MLGVGLYLIWEWADGVDPAIQSQRVRNLDTGELETRLVRVPDDERDTRGGTPYLAWGLLLAGFSFGGFIPARLILGKSPSDKPRPMHGGEQLEVSAPDGSKLHVEIYGADNQPTLLLTHGWSLDHTAWSYVQQRLSDRFRIVVWDLPGLGRSQRPQRSDYSMENMSRCLAAVMDATANGPVILVGHSFGGMLLQTYCRMFPEYAQKVSALVLVHTTYTNPLRTALGWRSAALRAAADRLVGRLPRLVVERFEAPFAPDLFASDGFHPNLKAHTLWGERIAALALPLIGNSTRATAPAGSAGHRR
jgi:pimeloyl-ACP methyl ester carboxylesterase